MKSVLVCLALAATALAAPAKKTKGSTGGAVLQLTDETFDAAIAENDPLLVAFTAPWCGHCKQLKPEYEKAAKELKADGLKLANVDATASNDLATRFEVSGFPTLKFFRGGKPTEYNGGRDAASIVAWVRKRSGPAARTLTTVEEAEALVKGAEVSVIAFTSAADSGLGKALLSMALAKDDVVFGLVTGSEGGSADIRTQYGVGAEEEALVSFNDWPGQDNTVRYPAAELAEGIAAYSPLDEWVSAHSLPLVITFTQQAAARIFRGDIRVHYLLFADADADEASTAAINAFTASASGNRGKALYVRVPSSEDRVLGYFGFSAEDLPQVMLVNMVQGGEMKKYRWNRAEGDFTPEGFTAFLADFHGGSLKPFLKTEEAPDAATNAAAPVKIVTGSNFQQLVVDSEEDVLLEVYAPWCGHCKQLAPTYEALGRAVLAGGDKSRNTVIAKMDGTANEVDAPGFQVRGFPTIVFFPSGAKGSPVDYDGNRDAAGFVKFLSKHSTQGFDLTEEAIDVDEAADHGHDDHDGHGH